MNRYNSDSDDEYSVQRRRPESVRGSGWKSPSPTSAQPLSLPSSSSVTRIVVEPPFGSRKCDYNLDKSQRGRLIVTARRRHANSSDYSRSSNQKNQVAIQTFTIPFDADVDRLQSHVERDTNRLIIEIPRQQHRPSRLVQQQTSHNDVGHRGGRLLRSPDVERMLTSPTSAPHLIRDEAKSSARNSGSKRKLEYRIDCRGYTPDDLEVFVQGRDLMVHGKTKTSTSADPTQQRVSKKFTRKITLPATVDLANVVSYLEHGELRIEAPLKRGVYHGEEEIIIPGPPPTSTSTRATAALIANLPTRVRSPSPVQTRPHYRRNERYTRRRDYDRSSSNHRRASSPNRRVRSVESQRYPYYIPSRDLDEDDVDDDDDDLLKKPDSGHRAQTVIYRSSNMEKKESEPRRSIYSPTTLLNHARASVISRRSDYPSDDDATLKF